MQPKLYMFYIGGDCANSIIELHDVRFAIGQTHQDCYDQLRSQWWGTPESLHIDSYTHVDQVDGYNLTLVRQKPAGQKQKLFFLNLGGYDNQSMEEINKNILMVAESQAAAIKRALSDLRHWRLPHKDSLLEVEKTLAVSQMVEQMGFYLQLTQSDQTHTLKHNLKYIKLFQTHRPGKI